MSASATSIRMKCVKSICLQLALWASVFLSASVTNVCAGVVNRIETKQKVVALTFDADMTLSMLKRLKSGGTASWFNKDVIATLRKERIPATLFLTGLWIESYPAETRSLSEDPLFELGNHSYSHTGFHLPCYGLSGVPKSNEVAEIEKTDALLRKYATSYRRLFRFPGLCFDAEAVRSVEGRGYSVIGGDVSAGDGFSGNPTAIARRVVGQIRPGSIVILHMHGGPNAPHTATILSALIPKLRARGYSFAKVSDLMSLAEQARR